MIKQTVYQRLIANPLKRVQGKYVHRMSFGVSDGSKLDSAIISASLVALHFEDTILLISSGWENELRNVQAGWHYHIYLELVDFLPTLQNPMGWINVPDNSIVQSCAGQQIERTTVLESEGGPQGIAIYHNSMKLYISLGEEHNGQLFLGDSNEIVLCDSTYTNFFRSAFTEVDIV